jgi:dihydrofolate reductase
MGNIRVHEFVTLDGVFEDPRWTFDLGFDPKMGEAIAEIMGACAAILLGRQTYEMFEPAWSTRTADEDPGAPFMNESPKYVVSRSLKRATWNNSTILPGYSPESIRSLKESNAGDVYVSGSGTLVQAMLADGLVDHLHLFVYPVVLGSGRRLLDNLSSPFKLTLETAAPYENGVVRLDYARSTTSPMNSATPRGQVSS